MKTPRAPRLEERRAPQFKHELLERARVWIPTWGLADGERDFGRALLEIAARFSSEIAERLDGAGEKMRYGFLDWLAVRGEAARPARMPVVFKLADTAREPVLASAPIRMQVDANGTPVVFETEADVRLVPGRLEVVVGVDTDADAFYLPPPGMSDLEPLEPLPTQWQLKRFAVPGATRLQLDPDIGLTAEMIVEAAGQQYRILQVDKDIVTIEPALSEGLSEQTTVVRKVTSFAPFDGVARSRQEHILYIGDMDLFNIETAAIIEVVGAQSLGNDVEWHYWGKKDPDPDMRWQKFDDPPPKVIADAVQLAKAKGSIEPLEIGEGHSSRWIRASRKAIDSAARPFQSDELSIRVNSSNCDGQSVPCPPIEETASPAADAMTNTTPLVLSEEFYPFGKEPRQFDAFYLGSAEAFSKHGAQIHLCFELADPTFKVLTAVQRGPFAEKVLAGVGQDGALHLLEFNAKAHAVTAFRRRGPLQPPLASKLEESMAQKGKLDLDRQPLWPVPVWNEGDDFLVGTSAGNQIWIWRERANDDPKNPSGWISYGEIPDADGSAGSPVDGLVYLSDTEPQLFALRKGKLYSSRRPGEARWEPVATKAGNDIVNLTMIVPVLREAKRDQEAAGGQLVSSSEPGMGMVGVSYDNKIYRVASTGDCKKIEVKSEGDISDKVRPVAVTCTNNELFIVLTDKNCSKLITIQDDKECIPLSLEDNAKVLGLGAVITSSGILHFLATVRLGGEAYVGSWIPSNETPHLFKLPISASIGQVGGAPIYIAGHLLVPGSRADIFAAEYDLSGNVDSSAVIKAGVKLPKEASGSWEQVLGDTSTNPELSWEYWNGNGWWKLNGQFKDQTQHLKNSGAIDFEIPSDMAQTDWSGRTNHWIRARLIGGDYGREKVTVITSPPDCEGNTVQTVNRSTDHIRAPLVLKLHISYSICAPTLPKFVITRDSGSERDQSDANRTPGVIVEAFVPLAVTLSRISGTGASATGRDDCPSACDCRTADASETTEIAVLSAAAVGELSPALRRAIYIGLNASLSDAPVNVLLLVDEERPLEPYAPMTIEALIADRFVPVVFSDTTRALGESGLLSMAFDVAPTPMELFGKTLIWLRLTPAATSAPANWRPKLRGAYLNAAWASAAETLTRELISSSDGSPNLTLHLARPPLLRNTLELRVREPLGEEEREALRKEGKERVLSDVENLPGDWVLWEPVIDPADEPANARVYALDEASGEIRFGDGQHGRIPPVGRDSIVAFSYRRTESGASGTNSVPANVVTARTALNLVSPVESVEAVFAADQAAGGAPAEQVERVIHFGTARLRHRNRALTVHDLEELALQSSPDIVQARCLMRSSHVLLLVVMRGKKPLPNAAQIRELRRFLLEAAQPSLNAPQAFRIMGPAIRRLRIDLRLRVASLDQAGALAQVTKGRLAAYFDSATGGAEQEGWVLGDNPGEGDIALALIDMPYLEGIVSVALYEVAPNGTERPWPETIKPSELVALAEDGIRIQFEPVGVIS